MARSKLDQILVDILPWLCDKVQDKNREIKPETELITDNLLDSMEFLELVSFLEEKFNIELDPDILIPENFKTPKDIASMVAGTLD